jgi:toxin ParE1/3/4
VLAIRWRPEASESLANIIEYIDNRDRGAAHRLNARILYCVDLLRMFPGIGRPGRVEGTRELVAHPSYIVIYRVEPDLIRVVDILNVRQQYPPPR